MINYATENPMLPVIFIVLLAMLLHNIFSTLFKKYEEIDVHKAVSLMNDDKLTILDVREIKERQGGHINRDQHIPMAQVSSKLSSFNKDKPILVYCRSGMRSGTISQVLGKADFKAYNLKGGFNAWLGANMPISKK